MNAGTKEEETDVMMDELEYESDVEADLEVDELDSSGSDQENAGQTSVSPSKKAPAVKPGTRVPGHTLLPQVRIENILNADAVLGHLTLSKEGQFALSCATEEFIKKFALAGLEKARSNRQQNMVIYDDMADVVWRNRTFRFLRDTVPQALKIETAWELRGIRMKELMEDDPALGGIIPPGSFHHSLPDDFHEVQLPSIVVAGSSSKRKKNGEANGHSASAAGPSSKGMNANPEIASISTSGTPLASSSSRGTLTKNGSSASVATLNGHGMQTSTLSTPSEDKDDPMLDASEAGGEDLDDDESMTGHERSTTTTSAGAYMHGLAAAHFGSLNQDPGRTIYSQRKHPD